MKNGTAKGTALFALPLNYKQLFRLQPQLKQEMGEKIFSSTIKIEEN